MADEHRKDIEKIFEEGTPIDNALKAAVRMAVLRHKQLGFPLVDVRDGKVVLIPPDEIVVPPPPPGSEPPG